MLSVFLVLRELMRYGPDAMRLVSEPGLLARAVGASVGYGVLLVLPATAWGCALREGKRDALLSGTAIIIYARCNILKYLPGNVFHFGGRQVMAHRAGWSHRSTFMATTLEIVLLPLAAGCVALTLFGLSAVLGIGGLPADLLPADTGPDVTPVAATLGLALAAVAALGAAVMARRRGIPMSSLAAMAGLATGFFAASAALIAALALAMDAAEPADLPLIAAAYLASWIAGFIVPGAPGGIGVREAAFVHLAAAAISAPAALALAILARLVTTLGDLWVTLVANALALPRPELRNGG